MSAEVNYGWFGKVPCLGDFVRSGLSTQFVGAWDDWMQTLMIAGRQGLGERWRECYFSAPIWRFAFSAGIAGPRAATGILMPSIDRVGREYPLCLVAEMDAPLWSAFQALEPVCDQLEEIALAMLEDGSTLTFLKDALVRLPTPQQVTMPPVKTRGSAKTLATDIRLECALAALSIPEPGSIFVSTVSGENRLLLTTQLPSSPDDAASIFDIQCAHWISDD